MSLFISVCRPIGLSLSVKHTQINQWKWWLLHFCHNKGFWLISQNYYRYNQSSHPSTRTLTDWQCQHQNTDAKYNCFYLHFLLLNAWSALVLKFQYYQYYLTGFLLKSQNHIKQYFDEYVRKSVRKMMCFPHHTDIRKFLGQDVLQHKEERKCFTLYEVYSKGDIC